MLSEDPSPLFSTGNIPVHVNAFGVESPANTGDTEILDGSTNDWEEKNSALPSSSPLQTAGLDPDARRDMTHPLAFDAAAAPASLHLSTPLPQAAVTTGIGEESPAPTQAAAAQPLTSSPFASPFAVGSATKAPQHQAQDLGAGGDGGRGLSLAAAAAIGWRRHGDARAADREPEDFDYPLDFRTDSRAPTPLHTEHGAQPTQPLSDTAGGVNPEGAEGKDNDMRRYSAPSGGGGGRAQPGGAPAAAAVALPAEAPGDQGPPFIGQNGGLIAGAGEVSGAAAGAGARVAWIGSPGPQRSGAGGAGRGGGGGGRQPDPEGWSQVNEEVHRLQRAKVIGHLEKRTWGDLKKICRRCYDYSFVLLSDIEECHRRSRGNPQAILEEAAAKAAQGLRGGVAPEDKLVAQVLAEHEARAAEVEAEAERAERERRGGGGDRPNRERGGGGRGGAGGWGQERSGRAPGSGYGADERRRDARSDRSRSRRRSRSRSRLRGYGPRYEDRGPGGRGGDRGAAGSFKPGERRGRSRSPEPVRQGRAAAHPVAQRAQLEPRGTPAPFQGQAGPAAALGGFGAVGPMGTQVVHPSAPTPVPALGPYPEPPPVPAPAIAASVAQAAASTVALGLQPGQAEAAVQLHSMAIRNPYAFVQMLERFSQNAVTLGAVAWGANAMATGGAGGAGGAAPGPAGLAQAGDGGAPMPQPGFQGGPQIPPQGFMGPGAAFGGLPGAAAAAAQAQQAQARSQQDLQYAALLLASQASGQGLGGGGGLANVNPNPQGQLQHQVPFQASQASQGGPPLFSAPHIQWQEAGPVPGGSQAQGQGQEGMVVGPEEERRDDGGYRGGGRGGGYGRDGERNGGRGGGGGGDEGRWTGGSLDSGRGGGGGRGGSQYGDRRGGGFGGGGEREGGRAQYGSKGGKGGGGYRSYRP